MRNAMHDFEWVISDFLLQHLRVELIVTAAVLAAVLVLTAVFVHKELRAKRGDDHEDQ